jgi:RHS repeat-associated protein
MAPADTKTGTYSIGGRLLDPSINRFLGADEYAGAAANMELQTDALTGNRYLYAGANPANLIDDGHKPLYQKHKKSIKAAAARFGVDPVMLGILLQQEGPGQARMKKLGSFGRTILRSRLGGSTVGIMSINPNNVQKLVKDAGLGDYTVDKIRQKLIDNDDFSIQVAAAYVANLKKAEGYDDYQAYMAYAYSARGRDWLESIDFDPRNAGRRDQVAGSHCAAGRTAKCVSYPSPRLKYLKGRIKNWNDYHDKIAKEYD